ncbi:MAG: rhodanese-like domain-containing protein [Desulfomonilaceae bacterium]|nr:rhodanese-like domain-containing protein [Desulfomonilaceae bacterium]
MRAFVSMSIRAFIILAVSSGIGMGLNLASSKPLPWVYQPPKELTLEGTTVALIDEKEARKRFDDPDTLFVDTRTREEYSEGHVKRALFLPAYEKEEQFLTVEPLLTEDSLLILYCHGPECEMAEQVAGFLVQLGYKKLAIMSAGYEAWRRAGYPVEEPRG